MFPRVQESNYCTDINFFYIKLILGCFWALGFLWSNMKQKDRKSPKMWLLEVPLLTYCFCSITKHFISIFFVIWHMSYDVIFDALQIYIICFAWKCVIGDIESRSDWTYLLNYLQKGSRNFFLTNRYEMPRNQGIMTYMSCTCDKTSVLKMIFPSRNTLWHMMCP